MYCYFCFTAKIFQITLLGQFLSKRAEEKTKFSMYTIRFLPTTVIYKCVLKIISIKIVLIRHIQA